MSDQPETVVPAMISMDQSEKIGELATALAKAQGKMRHAEKDSVNTHFKNRYANLAAVIEAVRGPLSSEGIAFTQIPGTDARGNPVLRTRFMFKDQWIQGTVPILGGGRGPQEYGSALTYARRYSLSTMAGIAADEDDDGEAAEGRRPQGNDRPMYDNTPRREPQNGRSAPSEESIAHAFATRIADAQNLEALEAIGREISSSSLGSPYRTREGSGTLQVAFNNRKRALSATKPAEGRA